MASSPYIYVVAYQDDFQEALDQLREREFEQGRYNPVMFRPPHFVDDRSPLGPGRQHETIQEAMDAAGEDGTRSILDIESVGDEPGFGVARRLAEEDLEDYFETTKPTTTQILNDQAMLNNVERGEGVCFPTYDDAGQPVGICFAGYSCD
jgi:hypothetical protein